MTPATTAACTCPFCDEPVRGLSTTGPTTHFFQPCGCRADTMTPRAFLGTSPSTLGVTGGDPR